MNQSVILQFMPLHTVTITRKKLKVSETDIHKHVRLVGKRHKTAYFFRGISKFLLMRLDKPVIAFSH